MDKGKFYVRAKADFIRDGNMPVRFQGGRFYEVDNVHGEHCQVVSGDISCGWNIAELDEHFERIQGNFLDDMAFRAIFRSVGIYFGQTLLKNCSTLWNAIDSELFLNKMEEALKRMFLYQRRAQPDTKLADWGFILIQSGKLQYGFADVVKESMKPGFDVPDMGDLTVAMTFQSDRSFSWTVAVKTQSTFSLD